MTKIERILMIVMAVACLMMMTAGAEESDEMESVPCVACHSEGKLNIRSGPGANYEKICYLLPGEEAQLIATEGGWAHIKLNIEYDEGWVKAEYLSTDPDAHGAYINAGNGALNVRDGVNGRYKKRIKKGATVQVQAVTLDRDGNRWAYIGSGWVIAEYLEAVEDE